MHDALDQSFLCESVPPEMMDRLWAAGWRHFGETFFRYSHSSLESEVKTITPLRVDLEKFMLSKSQRRVLKKNADLRCLFTPATLCDEARAMFDRHKRRFTENIPEALETFLSSDPGSIPCPALACQVYLGGALVALSYLDLGETSTSAVYGMFEPEHAERSLGTYTMLREIQHSQERGSRYYYPGYATLEPSAYDYKKKLKGLETLDWQHGLWDDSPKTITSEIP